MSKMIKPDRRVMDLAWLRHGETIYTGEALVLALLFHTKGAGRGTDDHKYLSRMLDDPNTDPQLKRKGRTKRP
jgi:hypothetical protein